MDLPLHPHADSHCGGCHQSLDSDTGGVVVAFGNSLWHVDCFKCAKCGNKVTAAETNLLLLSDGSPVCSNCSYNCNVCKKPISDEAIMAGEESYHAACFTCRSCSRRIDELVFAKTSQGIYCMACHNERVARSRRHAEQKQRKARSSARKEREKARETGASTPNSEAPLSPFTSSFSPPSPGFAEEDPGTQESAKRVSTKLNSGLVPSRMTSPISSPRSQTFPQDIEVSPPAAPAKPAISVPTIKMPSPDSTTPHIPAKNGETYRHRVDTLPLPTQSEHNQSKRRNSYDDGVRPLTAPDRNPGLSAPSNKADRRRSVNPGMWAIDPSAKPLPEPQKSYFSPLSAQPPPIDKSYFSPLTSVPNSPSTSGAPSPLHGSSLSPDLPNVTFPPSTDAGDPSGQSPGPSSSQADLKPNGGTDSLPVRLPPRTHSLLDENARGRQSSLPAQGDTSNGSLGTLPLPTVRRSPSVAGYSTSHGGLHAPPVKRSASVSGRSSSKNKEASLGPPLPPKEFLTGPSSLLPLSSAPSSPSSDGFDRPLLPETPPAIPPIEFSMHDSDFSSLLQGGLSPKSTLRIVPPSPAGASSPAIPTIALGGSSITVPSTANSTKNGSSSISILVHDDGNPLNGSSIPANERSVPLPGAHSIPVRDRKDSNTSVLNSMHSVGKATKQDTSDLVIRRLREALNDATERGASTVRFDREFVEAIVRAVQGNREKYSELKGKFDGMRRASQQFIDGLSVAQNEYDIELAARRDAEAEVTRLRVQLSGQAARLTVISSEDRKRGLLQQMEKDLTSNLHDLEQNLSKLRVERDLAVAEVEEIKSTTKTPTLPADSPTSMSRSLTQRFDSLKVQYQYELEPLMRQREALSREIQELKEERNIFLEETTALNARNEELAELNAQMTRKFESTSMAKPRVREHGRHAATPSITTSTYIPSSPSLVSVATTNTLTEEKDELGPKPTGKVSKPESNDSMPSVKKFMWFKASSGASKETKEAKEKEKETSALKQAGTPPPVPEKVRGRLEHNFKQESVLRFARCDHCGDKMWGTQLRCSSCSIACHMRCINLVQSSCKEQGRHSEEVVDITPLPPSMFGRDLIEQVHADAKGDDRMVPVLVEKCIAAVEGIGMDYEGIYRKTGGSSQSKAITQWFERGDYDAFDLLDTDTFNDISSVTSVLKNYFRGLPNPLLTYTLHEAFVQAAGYRDPEAKSAALTNLVAQLPPEHYHTLQFLMMHLYRVRERSEENLMNARNLGVVFGPTLMRSPDSTQEFADMAGKALSIEWLIENAPSIFQEQSPSP